ncbi:ATP-dependent DNA helicase UvrD2 [Corynebacterium lizhenjunii]|uniref:ATP-dependent DNA helicase UvrD2 n=1 Tax=Corynebacterium lizhenjunii TaxID=2709394 RepID=UPI0013ED8D5B|nr:ATP-dependent DNA helicase UvrD2 [Corynebacterium lizhenjunii]
MTLDLSMLDADQRAAAQAPRGPVCILAGAGTGKTRTITYRIANLVDQGLVSPQRVLAVTYTNRAAGEMRDRLHHMGIGGVQARTFHSAALRQLKFFWPQVVGDLPWRLETRRFPLVGRAVRSAGLDNSTDMVRDVLAEIDWAKSYLLSPDGYPEAVEKRGRKAPADPAKVARAYRHYEEMKSQPEGMLLDFSDVLIHVAGAIENSAGVADQFRAQYRTFVVDEYQDVTPLQQRVLSAWLGQRDDLTVVGDANQTIYSFTGASPDFLLDFSRTYPQATVVKLQRDYRSTPQITALANEVISQAVGRAAGTRLELVGMREKGPEPQYQAYDSEPAEAQAVAEQIQKLLSQGVRAAEIAILYRTNAQSVAFEEALSNAGVVYQVRGGEGFFERTEIRQGVSELVKASRRTDLPEDPVAIARAAFVPLGLSSEEPDGAQARERWQSLKALLGLVEQIVADIPGIDLPGVCAELALRQANKQPPTVDGVTLASMHAAKGLEWDAVFLVGLQEGSVPISHAIRSGEDEQIEEERRLFYVGVTRAREHLYCSWTLAKNPDSHPSRKRTRFLDGIVPDVAPAAAGARTQRARRCRVCRLPLETPRQRSLGRHEECDGGMSEDIFSALRVWRSERARHDQVPPYIIFTDATLMAIAEQLPQDQAELLSISGIGEVKLANYGAEVLQVLAQFSEHATGRGESQGR